MSVTIVLPLKGRHGHTLRWLRHAERIRLPFPVIIADGDLQSPLAPLLEEGKTFPSVNYRYLRYDDQSWPHAMRKFADAIRRADTEYVMVADNDDFISPSFMVEAAAFLDGAPDYCAVNGRHLRFSLHPDSRLGETQAVMGDMYNLSWNMPADAYADQDAVTRVGAILRAPSPCWYNVTRREVLAHSFDIAGRAAYRNFEVLEYIQDCMIAGSGRIKILPSLFYIRQEGTSLNKGWAKPFMERVFLNDWMGDFAQVIAHVAKGTGLAPDALEACMRQAMCSRMTRLVQHDLTVDKSSRSRPLLRRLRQLGPLRRLRTRLQMDRLCLEVPGGAVLAEELREISATLSDPELLALCRHAIPEMS